MRRLPRGHPNLIRKKGHVNFTTSQYIPTENNASGVTRSADVCNDSGTSAEFNDSEGVLFAEIAAVANDGTNRRIAIPNTGFTALHRLEYFSTDNVINAVNVFYSS